MPKISLIVPIYNVDKYIERCIESVLKQTLEDFELILIDDGSTDKSSEICNKYKEKDRRVRVKYKTNGGVSSARNEGIDMAIGEYIGFLDPDDYLDIDALDYLYNIAQQYQSDIACYRMKIYINETLQSDMYEYEEIHVYTGEEIIKEYTLSGKFLYSSCNKIYSKKLFLNKSNRFSNDIRYAEDALFNYLVLCDAEKLVFSNQKKYNYCINSEGVVSNVTEKRLDIFKSQKRIYHLLDKKYNDYAKTITKQYILSSILLVSDIALEKKIFEKRNILIGLKKIINEDEDILSNLDCINFKNRICFFILKLSPISIALLYRVKFILR